MKLDKELENILKQKAIKKSNALKKKKKVKTIRI